MGAEHVLDSDLLLDRAPRRSAAEEGALQGGLYKIDLRDDIDGDDVPPSAIDVFPIAPSGPDMAYVLVTQPGAVHAVLRWLQLERGGRTEVESGLAPHVAVVRYDLADDPWNARYGAWEPFAIKLRRQGITTVHSARAPDESIQVGDEVCGAEVLGIRPPDVRSVLTARQQEVIEVAAAIGHYEVPRRAGVQDVASALGVGTATTSELLRRAESALIWRHLDDDVLARRRQALEGMRPVG